MPIYKPLELPWKHNVHDGIPVPTFLSSERYEEIKTKHQPKPGDVFIATYQKSGTTWLQHIVNQLLEEPQGKDLRITDAVLWLQAEQQTRIDNMASPRIFKTHDRWKWIPKSESGYIKYIYCYRNPKDVAISDYFQKIRLKELFGYEGSVNNFVQDVFLNGDANENGSYFTHVAEWLQQKDNSNILFLTYEDMQENLHREIIKIAKFLQCKIEDRVISRIVEGSSFASMKANDKTNYDWGPHTEGSKGDDNLKFMRKGIVGDGMNYLSDEHSRKMEELVEKRLLPLGARIRYTV